jgi:hypothetical protein
LTNPYAGGAVMTYRLLWNGEPKAGTVVHVFRRLPGAAEATMDAYTTDISGQVSFPVAAGAEYLVNAVHMIEPTPEFHAQTRADWVSLWASETFKVE